MQRRPAAPPRLGGLQSAADLAFAPRWWCRPPGVALRHRKPQLLALGEGHRGRRGRIGEVQSHVGAQDQHGGTPLGGGSHRRRRPNVDGPTRTRGVGRTPPAAAPTPGYNAPGGATPRARTGPSHDPARGDPSPSRRSRRTRPPGLTTSSPTPDRVSGSARRPRIPRWPVPVGNSPRCHRGGGPAPADCRNGADTASPPTPRPSPTRPCRNRTTTHARPAEHRSPAHHPSTTTVAATKAASDSEG